MCEHAMLGLTRLFSGNEKLDTLNKHLANGQIIV